MGNFQVEYTITARGRDGKEITINKKRFLTQDLVSDPKEIQGFLEREFQETEKASFLNEMQSQLGEEITETNLRVDRVTELVPTGDDDQM